MPTLVLNVVTETNGLKSTTVIKLDKCRTSFKAILSKYKIVQSFGLRTDQQGSHEMLLEEHVEVGWLKAEV